MAKAPPSSRGVGLFAGLFTRVLLLLIATALFKNPRRWQSYLRRKPLLMAKEREFYRRLTRTLLTYAVLPRVAFSALITVDGQLSDRQKFSIRRRLGWKCADFAICQPFTLALLLIIKLDDRIHDTLSDRQRDATTKAAGYQTLRSQSRHKPTVQEMADLFARLLPALKP